MSGPIRMAARLSCQIWPIHSAPRRNHHPYRLTLVARSIGEVIQEFNGYAAGPARLEGPHDLRPTRAPIRRASPLS